MVSVTNPIEASYLEYLEAKDASIAKWMEKLVEDWKKLMQILSMLFILNQIPDQKGSLADLLKQMMSKL